MHILLLCWQNKNINVKPHINLTWGWPLIDFFFTFLQLSTLLSISWSTVASAVSSERRAFKWCKHLSISCPVDVFMAGSLHFARWQQDLLPLDGFKEPLLEINKINISISHFPSPRKLMSFWMVFVTKSNLKNCPKNRWCILSNWQKTVQYYLSNLFHKQILRVPRTLILIKCSTLF